MASNHQLDESDFQLQQALMAELGRAPGVQVGNVPAGRAAPSNLNQGVKRGGPAPLKLSQSKQRGSARQVKLTQSMPVGNPPLPDSPGTPVGNPPLPDSPGTPVGNPPLPDSPGTPVGNPPLLDSPGTPVGIPPQLHFAQGMQRGSLQQVNLTQGMPVGYPPQPYAIHGMPKGISPQLHLTQGIQAGSPQQLHLTHGVQAGNPQQLHLTHGVQAGSPQQLHITQAQRWAHIQQLLHAQTLASRAVDNSMAQNSVHPTNRDGLMGIRGPSGTPMRPATSSQANIARPSSSGKMSPTMMPPPNLLRPSNRNGLMSNGGPPGTPMRPRTQNQASMARSSSSGKASNTMMPPMSPNSMLQNIMQQRAASSSQKVDASSIPTNISPPYNPHVSTNISPPYNPHVSTNVSSPYNPHVSNLKKQDYQRMLQKQRPMLGNSNLTSTQCSTSAPLTNQASHSQAKRSLNAPHYGAGQGPPPKKGLFAPPVVAKPMKRSTSDGGVGLAKKAVSTNRSVSDSVVPPHPSQPQSQTHKHMNNKTLGKEAAKQNVNGLNLQLAEFKGIDKHPDGFDLPKFGQAGTTAQYTKHLQDMKMAAEKKRRDSGTSLGSKTVPASAGVRKVTQQKTSKMNPSQLDQFRRQKLEEAAYWNTHKVAGGNLRTSATSLNHENIPTTSGANQDVRQEKEQFTSQQMDQLRRQKVGEAARRNTSTDVEGKLCDSRTNKGTITLPTGSKNNPVVIEETDEATAQGVNCSKKRKLDEAAPQGPREYKRIKTPHPITNSASGVKKVGLTQMHLEIGNSIKNIVDDYSSFHYRYGHLDEVGETTSPVASTSRSVPRQGLFNDDIDFNHREVINKVRHPAYSMNLPDPTIPADILSKCPKDADGFPRAPDGGITEETAEVLWLLQTQGNANEWRVGADGEWTRPSRLENPLRMHCSAFMPSANLELKKWLNAAREKQENDLSNGSSGFGFEQWITA